MRKKIVGYRKKPCPQLLGFFTPTLLFVGHRKTTFNFPLQPPPPQLPEIRGPIVFLSEWIENISHLATLFFSSFLIGGRLPCLTRTLKKWTPYAHMIFFCFLNLTFFNLKRSVFVSCFFSWFTFFAQNVQWVRFSALS